MNFNCQRNSSYPKLSCTHFRKLLKTLSGIGRPPDDLVARVTTKQLAEDRIYFIGRHDHPILLCIRVGPWSFHWRQTSFFLRRFEADPRWPSSWHQIPWDNLWYSIFGIAPLIGLTNPLSFFGRLDTTPLFPVTKKNYTSKYY